MKGKRNRNSQYIFRFSYWGLSAGVRAGSGYFQYPVYIPFHQPVCVSHDADSDFRRDGPGGTGPVPLAEG